MCKVLIITLYLYTSSAYGQVTQIEFLNFGKLVVTNNDTVSSLTLKPGNTSSSTNNIYVMQTGHTAELVFDNYPSRIQLTISDFINNEPLTHEFNSNFFILNRLIYNSVITTDSVGRAILNVGGQLSTTGDGASYVDGNYNATINITIDY